MFLTNNLEAHLNITFRSQFSVVVFAHKRGKGTEEKFHEHHNLCTPVKQFPLSCVLVVLCAPLQMLFSFPLQLAILFKSQKHAFKYQSCLSESRKKRILWSFVWLTNLTVCYGYTFHKHNILSPFMACRWRVLPSMVIMFVLYNFIIYILSR